MSTKTGVVRICEDKQVMVYGYNIVCHTESVRNSNTLKRKKGRPRVP